jgi:spoIIIJ-associated protein
MDMIDMTAKSIEEAVELALLELDAERGEVAVEVISNGRAGLFGIGSEPAKVRVTRLIQGAENVSQALGVVSKLISMMEVDAMPTIRSGGDEENWPVIDIQGQDSGLLIGKRGETLRALQFVVNLMLPRKVEQSRVLIDVEHYRDRMARSLQALSARVAERVAYSGRSVTLEPMTAAERRVVHIALADHSSVTTESEGFGEGRRVTVMPR